jgi:hypothetical protein
VYGETYGRSWDGARWQIVSFPNPVAGAELDIRPNGIGPWRLMWASWLFTASAAVANRVPTFRVDADTLTHLFIPSATVIAASATQRFQGVSGTQAPATVAGIQYLGWPYGGVVLRPGDHLRSTTALIDVADQYSAVVAMIEEIPWYDSAASLAEAATEARQYMLP